MELKLLAKEKKLINFDLFACAFLLLFFVLVNKGIEIRALAVDDLGVWNRYSSSSPAAFIFNLDNNKIRPVLNVILYALFRVIGPRIWLATYAVKILNFAIAVYLYFLTKKITNNYYGLFAACMFVVSRFAYYSISQVFGIMESLALVLSIIALYLLYLFVTRTEKGFKYFLAANIIITVALFVHERFIAMFALSILAVLIRPDMRKNKKKALVLAGIALLFLAANGLFRFLLFGGRAIDGTAGVAMQESFNIVQALKFFAEGIGFILGLNPGPQYLNGISYTDVPKYVTAFVAVSALLILFLIVRVIIALVRKTLDNGGEVLRVSTLFAGYTALMLLSGCLTIRLEMRWIYAPFTVFMIWIAYLAYQLDFRMKKSYAAAVILAVLLIGSGVNMYYRMYFGNLYYWPAQQYANSLNQETFGVYKADIYKKNIYILENDEAGFVADEYYDDYFEVFTYGTGRTVKCTVVDAAFLEKRITKYSNFLVFMVDTDKRCYVNVTEMFRVE